MSAAPASSTSVFRIVTAIVAVVLAVVLAWGLMHESASPTVFGRFSTGYAGVLGMLLVLLLICLWAIWKQPRRLVHGLTNAYVFVGSLVVSFTLLEAGLRVANPWGMDFFHWLPFHMQGMVDHPELGYVHPRSTTYRLGKNLVTLNAHGLRGKEIGYDKRPGEKRILLLGDSVTFGWGVSDGEPFADQMEPLLKARTGQAWAVINAGVNGYNTQQEATYFRIEGVRYHPDVVVLIYVSNDLDPVIKPNLTTWRRYPSWPESLPEAMSRLRSLSYTFQAAQMFLRARQLGAQRAGEVQDTSSPSLTSDPRWPDARNHLRQISELSAEREIKFLVAAYDIGDPAFFTELSLLGIDAVPLGEAFADVPQSDAYVSKVDPHPSAILHRRIAEFLVRTLANRQMLP